jgi:hypothetical protein
LIEIGVVEETCFKAPAMGEMMQNVFLSPAMGPLFQHDEISNEMKIRSRDETDAGSCGLDKMSSTAGKTYCHASEENTALIPKYVCIYIYRERFT